MLKFITKKCRYINGFTLAEVLITLGIIGVVASLTMPTLMDNHRKKTTVVRLERFYSVMSQAIEKYYNDNNMLPSDLIVPSSQSNKEEFKDWFVNGIGKNLKAVSIEQPKYEYNPVKVILADGSAFFAHNWLNARNALDIYFCVDAKHCTKDDVTTSDGNNTFMFSINDGDFVTAYKAYDSYTREQLLSECRSGNLDSSGGSYRKGKRQACSRLIQVDGWQIKDDYPWRQIMIEKK